MVNYRALIGRQWDYGRSDCFSLVREWFSLKGVAIPDFDRPADLDSCESLFLAEAEACGFFQVEFDRRRPGDVLIMRLGTMAPMHAAIVLENEQILHQRQDSLSAVEPLRQYYVSRVAAVVRHDSDRQVAG